MLLSASDISPDVLNLGSDETDRFGAGPQSSELQFPTVSRWLALGLALRTSVRCRHPTAIDLQS